jgi:predicted RNase H-like HicB family nuclease
MRWSGLVAAMLVLALLVPGAMAVEEDGKYKKYVEEKKRFADYAKKMHEWLRFGFVLNNDTFDEAKNFALATVDFAIASLESIKDRIQESDLSMKEEIIDEIDTHIAELLDGRENVEQASTVEELREAAKEVRQEWIEAKVSLQKALLLAALDRMETFVDKGERLEEFVEEKIAEFGEEGKDTTLLENWLEKYREDREKAYEKIDEAREKVMNIETPGQGFHAMKEIREAMKNAVEHTKECVKDLREIIRLINQYGDTGDVEELMEVVEEVVES